MMRTHKGDWAAHRQLKNEKTENNFKMKLLIDVTENMAAHMT